jgi:hypothetical protein
MATSSDQSSHRASAPAAEPNGKGRAAVPVEYEYSTNLPAVLERLDLSLVLSTYQAGKLITIGSHQGQLVFGFAGFPQVMGVSRTPTGLAIGSRETVWSLPASREIAPALEPTAQHDVAFLARQAHLWFNSCVEEIYALSLLPGVRNPVVIGPEPELDGRTTPWLVPPLQQIGSQGLARAG